MLLTLRGGPQSLAPKAHGVPVYPIAIAFLHAACTAHDYARLVWFTCHPSQASPFGYLPSPHDAFQEHAAHPPEWSGELSSNGSSGTCIPDGGYSPHSYAVFARRGQVSTETLAQRKHNDDLQLIDTRCVPSPHCRHRYSIYPILSGSPHASILCTRAS